MPASCEPGLELGLQRVADLVGVAAQRDRLRLVVVVGVLVGEMAQRGLALHGHELLVVGDVEHRLGRVGDAPHDDRGDLDRVAAGVVDLDPLALEVAHPQRDLLALVERVAPPQAGLGDRPDVAAEQDQHARLVGLDDERTRPRRTPKITSRTMPTISGPVADGRAARSPRRTRPTRRSPWAGPG